MRAAWIASKARCWPVLRGVLGISLVTAIGWRLNLTVEICGFLYLIVIVLNVLDTDYVSAVIVSIAAVACLDFFFTKPALSFRVSDLLEAVALGAFLVTSLVVTRLSSTARHRLLQAQTERRRTEQIHRVTEQLLALEPANASGEGILKPFVEVFGLTGACLFDGRSAEMHSHGVSVHNLSSQTRQAFLKNEDRDLPAENMAVRCLRSAGKVSGAIGFEGLCDPGLMAGPLTAVAASCLHRVRAYEAASRAAAQEQVESLRGAILDALAHEFKTPLSTILTAAGGLREVGPLAPDQEELADLVESESLRLGTLTSRLLRTAQLDREDVRPKSEAFDLGELAEDVVERYSELWLARRFDVTGIDAGAEVVGDQEMIRLALNQIMDNACKYSKGDSSIELRLEVRRGMAEITIWSPSGPIPQVDRERVFERFYRGRGEATHGTGLGLYVARKIAAAHGGRLTLDPEDERRGGTAFRFALPVPEGATEK